MRDLHGARRLRRHLRRELLWLCLGLLCLASLRRGEAQERYGTPAAPTGEDAHDPTLGRDCQRCHRGATWKIDRFDHDGLTRYALTGKHQELATRRQCLPCHPGAARTWKPLPTRCSDGACHAKDDRHQRRYQTCDDCHSASGWKPLVGRGQKDTLALPDRWRIGYTGHAYDPYNQNVLKGDYPIDGKSTFLILTLVSETLVEARHQSTPQGASPAAPGSSEFLGNGRAIAVNQNLIASLDLFRGSTAFRPKDWEARVTPVFNVNYVKLWENGAVNSDLRRGNERTAYNFRSGETISLQELFVGARLLRVSRRFDFVSLRAGIQGFTSDFRGFIYADNQPGLKLFGNFANNRYQWSAAYFYLLEKDTNSRLNTFVPRNQHVGIVNLYRQDSLRPGYTAQLSFHFNLDLAGSQDPGGQRYNTNGFLVRPAPLGALRPHNVKVYYLGLAGEGHLGPLNLSHAFYQVLGSDDFNPIANRPVFVNAQLAALELSGDINWLRPKAFAFFTSGDRDPRSGQATGFDSIVDNVDFAGGGFSFFNRQAIGLLGTGTNLVNPLSLIPSLRTDKNQGQANFVNTGLLLGGVGLDADLTPKLKGSLNVNALAFVATEPLNLILQQGIRRYIGEDYALRLSYRPFLNNNVFLTLIGSVLRPGPGLADIGFDRPLFSTAGAMTLAY